jgi:hypothetical protein
MSGKGAPLTFVNGPVQYQDLHRTVQTGFVHFLGCGLQIWDVVPKSIPNLWELLRLALLKALNQCGRAEDQLSFRISKCIRDAASLWS